MGQIWDRTTVPHNTGAVGPDTLHAGWREAEATGPANGERSCQREECAFDKIHRREGISSELLLAKPLQFFLKYGTPVQIFKIVSFLRKF